MMPKTKTKTKKMMPSLEDAVTKLSPPYWLFL
jgi:hypothetical protein